MSFAAQRKRSAWFSLALILAGAVSAQAQLPGTGTNVSVQSLNFAHMTGGQSPIVQTVQIASDPERAYTATATVTTPSGGPNWLTVNGAASASGNGGPGGTFVTVGVVPGSLPVGTYTGNVRVQPNGLAAKDIPVTLRVSALPQVALNVPIVSIQGQAGTQVSTLVPISSTGAAVGYTATVGQYQGATGWLTVTPSGTTGGLGGIPTQATLTANLTGVPSGTHYAVVTFKSSGGEGADVTLPVILIVTQATTVSANPTQLRFAFQASNLGATSNNKVINITSAPNTGVFYTATVSGDSHVTISNTSTGPGTSTVTGTTPGNLHVLVNPVGIPAGNVVEAVVTITTTNNTVTVPVRVAVTNDPLIAPNTESVNFNYSRGGTLPPAQTISLTATTGQLAFTATEAEVNGGDWLSVTTNATSTPGNVNVSVKQDVVQTLAAGTYTANITITGPNVGNAPITIPVTLTVSGTAGLLNVSTSGGNNTLTFTADQNGQVPGNQTVTVASTDGSNQSYTIAVDPPSAASWVLLGTRTGQTGTTGNFFTVGVSPSGVPGPGKHEADIVVTPGASAGTTPIPQKVHVVFNVNATTTITATPARVEVTQAGTTGQPPAPVTVTLASAVTGLPFIVSTQPPVAWVTADPQNGTLAASTPIRLTFNTAGLAAGRHETVVRVSPTGANEVAIPVTLTIANAQLNVSQPALTVNYAQGTPAPANLTVGLTSSNTPINFTAAATSTGNWLSVLPASGTTGAAGAAPTNLALAINPAGLTVGTHTGTVTLTSPDASNSPQTVTVTLNVTAAAIPVISSVENAARNEQTLIAPGLVLAIKGTNLGPATEVGGTVANGAVTTTAGEARVLFDGIPAPIFYASARQLNVVAPYSLFGRTSTRVQVEYRGVRSDAIEYRVVDVAPGLFTANMTGRGLGAILNQNLTVNSVTNPARQGEVIVLYATGEGRLRPSPADGAIVTGTVENLPRPVAPVAVRINGQEVGAADIFYAGSAPGILAGVMQINVRIPATLNITGPAQVPVEISVGGSSSQSGVTVAVIP